VQIDGQDADLAGTAISSDGVGATVATYYKFGPFSGNVLLTISIPELIAIHAVGLSGISNFKFQSVETFEQTSFWDGTTLRSAGVAVVFRAESVGGNFNRARAVNAGASRSTRAGISNA
jgi:hypothetical protein